MKQYNKKFIEQLSRYATDPTPMGEADVQRLYQLVSARGKIQAKPPRKHFRPLLLAAIVGTALLATAAAFYSVSDAFRGILREQDTEGGTAPLSSMAPIVDKSGTLVDNTVSSNGLDVTVRGIVGDANNMLVLVDVEDPAGAPLSQDIIRFGGISIRTEASKNIPANFESLGYDIDFGFGDAPYRIGAQEESIYVDSSNSKVTMLISIEISGADIPVGDTLYLSLKDVMEMGYTDGTPIGMESGDLYDIVNSFGPISSEDLIEGGHSQDRDTGDFSFYYSLVTNTNQAIPLASGLPGYMVTNAGLKDNVLYLRGTGEGPLQSPELWNPQTDEYSPMLLCGYEDNGHWTASFSWDGTLEELKDYVIVQDKGYGLVPLRKGEWSFTIPLDYENTTNRIPMNTDFEIGGFPMQAEELTLSPYFVSLKTSVDDGTYDRMMHRENPVQLESLPIIIGETDWDKVEANGVLTMRDGSQIQMSMYSGSLSYPEILVIFELDVVIDPDQVESFSFGDLVYNFSE